jgi:hypothetical protein
MTRPLTRSLRARPGESLAGWVNALSYRLDLPPRLLIAQVGLTPDVRQALQHTMLFGIPHDVLDVVAANTSLPLDDLRAMTLDPLQGLLWVDPSTQAVNGKPAPVRAAMTPAGLAWLDPGVVSFCPHCLADDPDLPIWPLRWSLPWSFACTRHNVLLRGTCDACGLHPRHSRTATLLPHLGLVAHPAACRSSGPQSQTCLTSLAAQPARGLRADDPILTAQRRLDVLLKTGATGHSQSSLGMTVPGDQWLRDLRALSVLAQLGNLQLTSNDMDASVVVATHQHIADRSRTRKRDGHTGADRTWKYAPPDPLVRAGLITWAVSVLDSDDNTTLLDQVDSLVEAAKINEPELWQRIRSTSRASTGLHSRFSPKHHGTMSTSMLHVALGDYRPNLEARHIPPHLTDDLYHRHLAAIPNTTALNLRRTAAIGAVQTVTGWPMLDAAEFLGISRVVAWAAVSRTGRETRGTALDTFLRDRVADIVKDLDAAPRTDWKRRRDHFEAEWLIPAEDWAQFVEELIIRRLGRRDGDWDSRRVLASAYLWHQATGNDLTLAPMLVTYNRNGRRHTGGGADKARGWIIRSLHPNGRALLDQYGDELTKRIDFA